MSTKKVSDLVKRLEALEGNVKNNTRKTESLTKEAKKMGGEIMDFQDELGGAVVPFQKFTGYVTAFILFMAGLAIIITTAVRGFSDAELESHGYVMGGIFMSVGFLIALSVWAWTTYVPRTRGGRIVNAFMFERDLIRS
jgi:hypothetical protein